MPDVVTVGNHAYALTLNLFVTVAGMVIASIVFFKWRRRVEREDTMKKKLIEQREQNEADRHEQVIELIGERHEKVIRKIEDYCQRNDAFHRDMKRDFDNHYHQDDNVVIRRGGM